MKKLIFLLALLPFMAFGQRVYFVDSIPAPTGVADTTVYVRMFTGYGWSLEVNIKDFDEDSTIFDLGQCAEPDSNVFNRIDDASLPFNMVADSSHVFEKDDFLSRYLQIKMTVDGVTAGKKCYYWITKQ
jgi:hypothetical protein